MANINDRIKNIGEFFAGMQVENLEGKNYIYVIVKLPQRWKINLEETQLKFNVQAVPEQSVPGKYYFITEMEVGFDTVFDAIDYNIEKMIILEERSQLFKAKVEELKELFGDEKISIESLRTLEFKYKVPKIKTKTEKKDIKITPMTEEIIEEKEIEENE